ncbi:MAG: class I SAM-dependent methyltransferase [Planctomycetes bacterium]|nr:class I SAM-dependent methyltransferase [Planctomycetota bacterium]
MAKDKHKKPKKGKDKKPKKGDKKGKDKKPKGPTQADLADRYALYQRAVQEPDADIDFFLQAYAEVYGKERKPHTFREDFCAAANTACHWVKRDPANKAWGVDLDPEPLEWGRKHNVSQLNAEQQSRLTLIEGDVRVKRAPRVDITAAQNFSYYCFKTRAELLAYFKVVRSGLTEHGMFVVDVFGGPEAQTAMDEDTKHDGFTYTWDQERYDPISGEILCHIHFSFKDKSEIKRAFTYDWRQWTIPEVRELLAEAGFSESHAYWEGTDEETEEGNGEFTRQATAENEDAWIAYVIGVR